MSDAARELLDLARGLKARVAEGDLFVAPAAATPAAAPVQAARPPVERGGENELSILAQRLAALREQVNACRKCPLGSQRLTAVFGVGSPTAQVMFVGEGPGYQEDRQGEPFVGRAGQLLDDILKAIGLSRQTVYIANVVKCHPMKEPSTPDAHGNDRAPTSEEMDACRGYLEEQIRLIRPRFIVTLGNIATKALLREETGITKLRGRWRDLEVPGLERPVRVLPTFHPAALLRDPNLKRDVWTDMKNLRNELGRLSHSPEESRQFEARAAAPLGAAP